MPSAASPPAPRPSADRYTLLEQIGEGGMGVVWKAHDRTLDRKVALKVLHDRFAGGNFQARLAAEARAMARLSHPNVVAVYDVGEREGRSFLTMELVAGRSLGEWMKTPRGWREVAEVFRAAAAGLAAAHDAGLVHRDVKPSNILVGDDGRVRVADFGLAAREEIAGGMSGTPAYLPPERARGEPADARGDQYSFAIALREALPARAPGWLREVAARGASDDPRARYPSMHALAAALRGPRRIAPWIGGGVVLAGAIVAVSLWPRGGGDPCPSATLQLAGVWDDAARARITATFGALGAAWAAQSGEAVVRDLDAYAGDWVRARDVACRATKVEHVQPDDTLARRLACLDDRLAALGHLATALGDADLALATRATTATHGLPALADCADPAYLAGEAHPDLHADLAAAYALLLAAHDDDARDRAQSVADAALAAGDQALAAEALVVRGRAENAAATGDAVADLTRAADLAGAANVTRVRIMAWNYQADALQRLGRLDEAARVLDLGDAALKDAPDPMLEGWMAATRGQLLGRRGDYAGAAEHFDRAIDRISAAVGPDSVTLVADYENRAIALRHLGRYDDALASARRALELARTLGEQHPWTATAHQAVAVVLSEMGELDDARAELDAGLAALRAQPGPPGIDMASLEGDLAVIETRQGQLDAAAATMRDALAIRQQLAPDAQATLTAESNLADLDAQLGRGAEAEALARTVLAARVKMLGGDAPDVGASHVALAEALISEARLDDAGAELDRAIAIFTHAGDPKRLAYPLAEKAQLERARGRYAQALALDTRARTLRDGALPDGHPDRVESLVELAEDQLGLGHAALARPLAEAALAHADAMPPELAARARTALDRATRSAGGKPR